VDHDRTAVTSNSPAYVVKEFNLSVLEPEQITEFILRNICLEALLSMLYSASGVWSLVILWNMEFDNWLIHSVFDWFVKSDVSWRHLSRTISYWLFQGYSSLCDDWFDGTLTSIHLIGWWLCKGVVSFCLDVRGLLWFPISFIFFPGWGSFVDFSWDLNSFLLSGSVITSFSLLVFLFIFWSTECFLIQRFCGHVYSYSINNIYYNLDLPYLSSCIIGLHPSVEP